MNSAYAFYNIGMAMMWYSRNGYTPLEVPWIVSEKAARTTLPVGRDPHPTLGGCLVGSGEQSYIQMMHDGKLEPGSYVCCTPCFRDEHVKDDLHREYFMKVELIDYHTDVDALDLTRVTQSAAQFMSEFLKLKIRIVEIEENCCDIMCEDVELGSYGIRQSGEHRWVYGTGLAEPRASQCIERFSGSSRRARPALDLLAYDRE